MTLAVSWPLIPPVFPQHIAIEYFALSWFAPASFPQAYLAAPQPPKTSLKSFTETLGRMWEALPAVCRGQIHPYLHISNHSEVPRAPRQYGILDVFVPRPLDAMLRKSET